MAASRIPVIVDTDPGVDDAVALWWLLTHPRVDVLALTSVWGNGNADITGSNALRIAEACGRSDLAVFPGLDGPIDFAPTIPQVDFIHGADGLGNTNRSAATRSLESESAVDALIRLVNERPGEITVITIGPVSNIGAVLRRDPTWAERVGDLVVMGGSIRLGGNAMPWGEANIAHDPFAADLMVRAAWRRPPLLVPLDVTMTATFDTAVTAAMNSRSNAAGEWLADPMAFYANGGALLSPPGECPCHDLVATMAVTNPEILDAPVLPLGIVTTEGPAWGATMADLRAIALARHNLSLPDLFSIPDSWGYAPWRVALTADVPQFRALATSMFIS
jgi:purine nucleosidase